MKHLKTIKWIAKQTGLSHARVSGYVREGRIRVEYQDDTGRRMWSPGTARKIVKAIEKARAGLPRGRGQKVELPPKRRKARKAD